MRSPYVASVLAVCLAVPFPSRVRAGAPDVPAAGAPPTPAPGASPPAAGAPPAAADDAERRRLEEELARELGAAPPSGAPAPTAPTSPAPPQGGQGGNPFARLLLLPDVSAIGSAGAAFGTYDVAALSPRATPFGPADQPRLFFEELELGLQAVVDPYLRADVFVAFTPEEGADVEEAYVTTLALPAGLQVRAGTLFSPFGRLNGLHPHAQEFVDAPLARGRLLAEESLRGPGLDVAWLAPLPWYAELHLAAQQTAPFGEEEGGLTGVARVLQYFSLGEATTLGVGASAARRGEGAPGAFRDLGGADVHLRHRPLRSRGWLALQGELYARRLRGVDGAPAGTDTGWWAQAFWRQGARWGWGVRAERAPAPPELGGGHEWRTAALAAFLPSEFQRLRLQVAWDRRPGGRDGLEALLHLEFGIGAHGAHPF